MQLAQPATEPSRPRRATLAEWLAQPEEKAAELIRGRIVYKAFPSPAHGRAQRKLGTFVDVFDGIPGEAGRPGGWWLSTHDATAGSFFVLAASSMVVIGVLSSASVVLTRWGPKRASTWSLQPQAPNLTPASLTSET